jgi:hypothetical protein
MKAIANWHRQDAMFEGGQLVNHLFFFHRLKGCRHGNN